ncbi:MAG: hypothetical protein JNN09_01790 [Alphaproteobacteria bacterium]|nr:hypothetical protein [Alphaproteobacteria bacterium]
MSLVSHRGFGWAVLLSELGHVFCCVLPTLFTILSFAANIGLVGKAPGALLSLHEKMHHYEIPIIIFSGGMVGLGWGVFVLAKKFAARGGDCSNAACGKEQCHNRNILIIATLLFVVNVLIFAFVHKNIFSLSVFTPNSAYVHEDHKGHAHETH